MSSANVDWSEETRAIVGARLKRTRIQQRLSIRQMAERAQMSKTSVLQVEAGNTSRRSSYLKVAEVMGLHLDRLVLPSASEESPYALHRKADDSWFDLANFDQGLLPQEAQTDPNARQQLAEREGVSPLNILASRLEQGRIKPTLMELYGPSAVRSHAGEEHVYILQGHAMVSVGGQELALSEGESVTFWSSEPHFYAPQPDSKLPVKLLSVRVDA